MRLGSLPGALAIARIVCDEAASAAETTARTCLAAMGEAAQLDRVAKLLGRTPADTVALREQIAARVVEQNRVAL